MKNDWAVGRTWGGMIIGGGLGLVAAFILSMASIVVVDFEFVEPIASRVCSDGQVMRSQTQELSYRPGQRGTEFELLCCGPDGSCEDKTATVA